MVPISITQTLHRIIQHAGAEAAESGVERDTDTENQQTGFVRDACGGFQQSRAADKLHGHRTDKRNQQAEARQPYQQTALIAGEQHIVERYRAYTGGPE